MNEDMKKFLDIAIQAIDDEPEYPGEIPKELKDVLNKAMEEKDIGLLAFLMRLAVKQTKDGIRKRTLVAFSKSLRPKTVSGKIVRPHFVQN